MGVKLNIASLPFSELLPALEKGKLDMVLSGMTITPARNLKVAFVGPYFISGKAILTNMQTLASLEDADDMNRPDFTLAALKGSTSQEFAESVVPGANLVLTKSLDEGLDLVLKGKVDALISDYPFCAVSAFRYRTKGLATVETPFNFEPLGIALPATDPLLTNWLENFLLTLKGSGELAMLTEKWFKDASWVKRLP
jgi:polar amino acid transport system substrate-binding protein